MRTLLCAFAGEVKRIARDPGAILVLVGGALIYAVFYPLPYAREVLKESVVAVADLDASRASRTLARMLDEHELIRVEQALSRAEAEARVRDGDAAAAVIVPPGFGRALKRGEALQLPVYVDTAYFLTYRQVLAGASEAVGTFSAAAELARSGHAFTTRSGMRDPVQLLFRPLFNPTESYRHYVFPAVLVIILQQTLLVGIGMLHARGTRKTLASIVGASLAYVLLYAVHSAFYLGVVYPAYGFHQGAGVLPLILVTALFLPAVAFLGFALAAVLSSREAAIPAVLLSSLPILFLAGFAWPAEAIPLPMRIAGEMIPTTHACAAYVRLALMGAPLAAVLPQLLKLAGLATVYLAMARVAWRKDRA